MVKPRRTYTPEFKVRVVLEMLTSKKSLSQASREYGIKDSVLSRWRQEFLERAPQIFEQGRLKIARRSGSPSWSDWWDDRRCSWTWQKKSSGVRTFC